MASGDIFVEGSPDYKEHARLLDEATESGWEFEFAGSSIIPTATITESFVLPKTVREITTRELIDEHLLRREDGSLEEGYNVGFDVEADGVFVDYSGPYTDRHVLTLQLMPGVASPDDVHELRTELQSRPVRRAALLAAARLWAHTEPREADKR